jgi:GNAT superfamily N-acetyltransferase
VDPRYRVRTARAADLANVLTVLAQNQVQPPRGLEPTDAASMLPTEKQIRMWDRIRQSSDVTIYLAELGPEPVGTACLSVLPNLTYDCRPSAFIEAVVVTYAHRRKGVARSLVEHQLGDARRAGCHKVQLLSHKRHAHDGAHALYASLGFVAEAEGFRLYLS